MLKFIAPLIVASLTAGSAYAAASMQDNTRAFAGQYALADGRLLTIVDDNGSLTAQIIKRSSTYTDARFGEPRTLQLHQNGIASFASTSTSVQITFDADEQGQVAQVNLMEGGAATQGLARR